MNYTKKKSLIALICILSLAFTMLNGISISASAATYKINGAKQIIRPPVGSFASHQYSLEGYSDDITWSISDWSHSGSPLNAVPSGVYISQSGELIVEGSSADATDAADGIIKNNDTLDFATFKVNAADKNGNLLESTIVNYYNEITTWTDFPERVFDNLQGQTPGAAPKNKAELGNSGWVDTPLAYNRGAETNGTLEVVEEADGNRYIRAAGRFNQWSDASTLLVEPNSNIAKMTNEPYITLESRFKAEEAVLGNDRFSLWFICVDNVGNSADEGGLDIRYKKNGDKIGIYSHMNPDKSGVGRYNDYSNGDWLCDVEADTWFDARVEITCASEGKLGSFDLYINDKLVLNDAETVLTGIKGIRVGASIDDIAIYSGFKAVPGASLMPKAVYLTQGSPEAAIELDRALKIGTAYVPGENNSVKYSSSDAQGLTELNDRFLYLSASNMPSVDIVTESSSMKYPLNYNNSILISQGIEDSGPYASTYTKSGLNMDGHLYLEFEYSGTPEITFTSSGKDSEITASSAADNAEGFISLDTYSGKYTAILGTEKLQGRINTGDITELMIDSCSNIENISFASAGRHKPYLSSAYADGVPAIGLDITAKYDFFSPLKLSEEARDIKWYVSSDGISYSLAGSGDTFSPRQEHYNMYVRFEASATDSMGYTSSIVVSPSYLILPTYSASISAGNLNVTAYNIFSNENVYCLAALYNGSDYVKTTFTEIDFTSGNPSSDWTLPLSDADGAVVSVVRKSTLKPADSYKLAGRAADVANVESKNANDKKITFNNGKLYICTDNDSIAAVLIYGHTSIPGEANSAYYNIYSSGEVFDTKREELVWAAAVKCEAGKKTSVELPDLSGGAYYAEVISDSGEREELVFISKPELLLTDANITSDGFDKVLKLHDKALLDTEISDAISSYRSADNKNHILSLTANEITSFYPASKLINYIEGKNTSEANYNTVKNIMTGLKLNTKGLELLSKDADPITTGKLILTSTPASFNSLSDTLYEKAVLYGVYHVKSYLEADTFIKDLGCANYTSATKDGICSLVHGKLYESIAKLKEAILGYSSGGSGGTGGTGGTGGSGGSGGSGGMGTGGASGGTNVREPDKDSTINVDTSITSPTKKDIFLDVPSSHWANEAVSYLSQKGIVNGKAEGVFDPESKITRAEFASIIARAFNIKNTQGEGFFDVNIGDWYFSEVNALAGIGILKGANGSFRPNQDISREDAAVILCRMLKYQKLELKYADFEFNDMDSISDYALEDIKTLYSNDIIQGYQNSFMPKNNMSRAECSQMIANALRRYSL